MFAHSDAVQTTDSSQWLTNTPGADDDGSGCAAALEAARVLSQYQFQDTIKFAFFNAEEIGLVGSNRYAQTMSNRNENVPGSIDYDMIGYSIGTRPYDLNLKYNPASAAQGQYIVGVNNRYNIGLTIRTTQTTGFIPSDISSFYSYGFPGVFGIEEHFSPYYHTTNDLVKYINFTLVERCTKLAVASLSEMARIMYTDVSITAGDISIANATPTEDDNITIELNITNTGSVDAKDMELLLHINGYPKANPRISVPANSTIKTNISWIAYPGQHNLSITLDPKNEIAEWDEINNSAYTKLIVNDRPKAVLTSNPTSVLTNETIMFNGTHSWDLLGGVVEYNFSFGDGNGTGWVGTPAVSHAYPEDGIYNASLKVRDLIGAESKATYLPIIVHNRAPFADPSSNLTKTFTLVPIQFVSNAVDPDGYVFTHWHFGDGFENSTSNPVHSYSKSGFYEVRLDIKDDDGAGGSYYLMLIIENRPPVCTIDTNRIAGNITTNFMFTANASDADGIITTYSWELGDGTIQDTEMISHTYDAPGDYIVRLMVRDDEGYEARAQLAITVEDLPPVAIGEAIPTEVLTYESIFFTGEDSYDLEGPVTYHWNFNDGNTSSEASPIHEYQTPGTYIVILTVRDYVGQEAVINLSPILVQNRPPNAKFKVFGNFTENGKLYFDGTDSNDPDGNISYQWLFSDGTIAQGRIVEHVFSAPGNYSIELIVTDNAGESDTAQDNITVQAIYNPSTEANTTDKDTSPIINPKQPKTQKENYSGYYSIIIAINFLLVVIIVIVIVWSVLRPRKSKYPEIQPDLHHSEIHPPQPQATPTLLPPPQPSLSHSTLLSGTSVSDTSPLAQPVQAQPPLGISASYPQLPPAPVAPLAQPIADNMEPSTTSPESFTSLPSQPTPATPAQSQGPGGDPQ
jgi:PKD repeat protein